MSESRAKRNAEIIKLYWTLRGQKVCRCEAIRRIYESDKNKGWCLSERTILLIATDKRYSQD